ncbi:107f25ac-cb65-401b-816f-72ab3d43d814 [Sclerotinia trifoliorum]|uniref:107f25ac-cb65-401b-816f-72ab3d43d814 n=1 Tax=Sclerotinia trifoliorum TaxID=28548 RepID=A0A8H2W3K7_9HELO|nr:107f25ac-cb65-401b-816f-72ab3d43d814 [Sclerotinia trifoliorum]
MDSVGELSNAEKTELENGKQNFFAILEKMSTATAEPMSFVESCQDHGIDFSDPHNIKIEGTNLTPFPHQVIDMAWLARMEKGFFGGGILAGECGSGKTVIIFLLILMVHKKLKANGCKEHFATLIIVPSAVVDVWYQDFIKFFSDALICRIFYGGPGNMDSDREKCFVGTHIEDLDKELEDLDPINSDTSKTFFLTSYTTFARRAMRVTETNMKGKGKPKSKEVNYMSDEEGVDKMDPLAGQDERVLRKYELTLKNNGKLGRVVADEAHLIKNPCTLAADAIHKLQIERTTLVTATPMINRINDARGLLIQLVKVKELPLNLPITVQGLVSMYREGFNPLVDLPLEEDGVPARLIVPKTDEQPEVVRLYKAIKAGCPLHMLCPKAFLTVGTKSEWEPSVARLVLRPILKLIQRRRLMSNSFETTNGIMETPGKDIPHYTVKTLKLRMRPNHNIYYHNTTSEWEKNLFVSNEVGVPITSVKNPNSISEGTINMEAYRGLQLSSFDGQLTQLVKRKVKDVPAGTAKEVRSWYDRDDDHGITYKYHRTRPKEAYYITPPTNRLHMATTSTGLSPRQREKDAWLSSIGQCPNGQLKVFWFC